MKTFKPYLMVLLLLTLKSVAATSHSVPLFQNQEPLVLELSADFESLRSIRKQEQSEYISGRLTLQSGGTTEEFGISLKVRGQSRLSRKRCNFPLLFVRFQQDQIQDSLFQGQDVVPLTTHCRKTEKYTEYLHKENLVYKTYALLTPNSLKSRLAKITYVDTSGRNKPITRWAIFVEHFEQAAIRLEGEVLDAKDVSLSTIDPPALALMEVFQFLVANTDWSAPFGHNVLLVKNSQGIIPIAFDFDSSGVVNAPYAETSEKLPILKVTQRLFRGYCRPDEITLAAVDFVTQNKEEILSLVAAYTHLPEKLRNRLVSYYEGFFDIAEDPKQRNKKILKACR